MSARRELHFLLDAAGALIAFQTTGASWAAVLAFTSESRAREFVRLSNLDAAEIATIDSADAAAVAELVRNVKRRAIRNLLLDLDYASGKCVAIEFEGDALGIARDYQLTAPAKASPKTLH
ncbi:MAG TPA: hypothetical protein VNF27_09045 [Candidatus Binataceae bacterium]|nr:hypothetical protein [Candidatus Binataceae bacterium]